MITGDEFNSMTPLVKRETGKPWTYGEMAADYKVYLHGEINNGESLWPHKEQIPDELTEFIIEELVQIPCMADVEGDPISISGSHLKDTKKSLKLSDPLLVPFVGYQARFDKWNDKQNRQIAEGMGKVGRTFQPAF